MKSNYDVLGNYIRLIDTRNKDNVTDKVMGINIDKFFMPSVANVIGTDLSKYKLITKGKFACNPMHVGRDERLPVALYEEVEPALVSPAYFMFEIIDNTVLDENYLMMWFRRAEFDRICWLHTDGSVRGGITWDDICRMELPVPEIGEQRKIVEAYKIVDERIKLKRRINDNLEAQAFTIYKDFICDHEACTDLSDIAVITMGTSPEGESFNTDGVGDVFYQGRTDFGFRFPTIRLYTTEGKRYANAGDVLMSVRAPVGDVNLAKEDCAIGRGLASIRPKDGFYSFLYYTMQDLNFELKKFNDEGTVFGSITKDDLFSLKIVPLNVQKRKEFENLVAPIDSLIRANEYEIFQLQDVCSTMLSRLTH